VGLTDLTDGAGDLARGLGSVGLSSAVGMIPALALGDGATQAIVAIASPLVAALVQYLMALTAESRARAVATRARLRERKRLRDAGHVVGLDDDDTDPGPPGPSGHPGGR
jgi:hypothetical protein